MPQTPPSGSASVPVPVLATPLGTPATTAQDPADGGGNSSTDAPVNTATSPASASVSGGPAADAADPRIMPYTPDPANTRVLLRSLEDLRDSLSVRVEQLSIAVDRLRGQATELERAVSTGTALAPGFGRQRNPSEFEPLPRPHLGMLRADDTANTLRRRNRLADSVTITETVSRHHSRIIRARGPSPPPEDMPRRRAGLAPTNLRVVATQPQPTVVRTPATEDPDSPGESPTASFLRPVPLPPTEGITVETTTLQESRDAGDATSSSSFFEDYQRHANERRARRFAPTATLAPGMTLTGMRVEERIRASEEPVSPTSPSRGPPRPAAAVPRGREELDREIHQVYRRLEESQRDWYQYWNAERTRTLHTGGRLPNEYSAGRENAMRTHVETSHLLWTLVSRRTRLYGGPSTEAPRTEPDTMRNILETSPFRTGSNTIGSRRWPATFADGVVDPDTFGAGRVADRPVSVDGPFPRENAESDELLAPRPGVMTSRFSSRISRSEMPTYRYTPVSRERETPAVPAPPTATRTEPISPGFTFDDDVPPSVMRQQLLRYIERSRERVHQIARDLTPELLATEEPAMRRVLDGIELMMASPNITPHIRSRLERLAERERGLLRDLERGLARTERIRPAATFPEVAPAALATQSDSIMDRIESSRARVRDLSRVYRELQASRVSLGFDSAPRPESFSRRGSDAETVVPPSFSVSDAVTIESSDDEVPPPIPAPPTRLPAGTDLPPPHPPSLSVLSRAIPADLASSTSSSSASEDELAADTRPMTVPAVQTRPLTVPPVQIAESPLPITVPAVQMADPEDLGLAVPMEASPSSGSSASDGSSASSLSNRATLSHTRDEAPSSAQRKESGEFGAQNWPYPPPNNRRPPRPYVSILDL